MNSGKRKIALLIQSMSAGGAERVMAQLADYFCSRKDLEVDLVLFGRQPTVFFPLPGNLTIHKPLATPKYYPGKFYLISRIFYLRREIRKIDPDSILSFGEYWNSIVLISLLGLRYPVYISDRCSPSRKYGFGQTFLRKILYPRATGIIAQTYIAKSIYNELFRHNNIRIIGNPIGIINHEAVRTELIVLTIGRLIRSKNHDKLIEIFCNINNPDWKMIIVGDDALREENRSKLEHLIKERGASDRIIITGYVEDTASYYSKSSIFAFASESEGFPNVIGEAMSAGLPVIAFDCVAGPAEMIHDGQTGYLIPLRDYSQFRAKLELLMNHSVLREKMGNTGRDAIKQFSLASIGEKYLNFILEN